MSQSKSKNSMRNVTFGFILKFYQILMPFVIRTIIIHVLGMQYAGLNSLFVSILQVLNIAELGVSYALVVSMYKPIIENDKNKICALMKLYKTYYRFIGLFILVVGGILTPFIPKLINGTVPDDINVYVIYLLNLGATVLSYWLFAYKNSLFQAHQRNDVVSKISLVTDTIKYGLQISLLFLLKDYYTYLIILLLMQVINNITIALFSNKYYPKYKAIGELEKEDKKKINSSIKDLFYSKVGMVITNSLGSVVISAFLGLVPLAIYQNYYYILSSLIAFFTIIFISCRAAVGSNILEKEMEKNYIDFKYLTFIIMGFLTFSSCCLITMYQPFMKIWVKSENMLSNDFPILFAVYLVVYIIFYLLESYKDATGKWHADRFRPLVTSLVNLAISISLINFIGLYSVILGLIISTLFVNIPWLYHRVFIDVFDKKYKKDYAKYLIYKVFILIFASLISFLICKLIPIRNDYLKLCLSLIISGCLSFGIYMLFNIKDIGLRRTVKMIKSFLGKR